MARLKLIIKYKYSKLRKIHFDIINDKSFYFYSEKQLLNHKLKKEKIETNKKLISNFNEIKEKFGSI